MFYSILFSSSYEIPMLVRRFRLPSLLIHPCLHISPFMYIEEHFFMILHGRRNGFSRFCLQIVSNPSHMSEQKIS